MTRRIRVFHLIKSLGRGGAEMLLQESLPYADRDRFEYRYAYFLPWKDAMVPALQAEGVQVTCIPARGNVRILLSARRLAALLTEWETDILHCHLPVAGVVGRVAGRMAGVPVVYTEHNKQERYHPVTRFLNHQSWRRQSQVIAVSEDVARSIRAHVGSDVPVAVVRNGVAVERFRRDAVDPGPVRARYRIPEGAPVVGTVAVFRVQKRLHDWLDAAHRIRERSPEVRFLLVGDGPLKAELEEKADALGLRDVLYFTGLQEDVRPWLAAMDIYMMSSIFEGLPVALLEAMSMGCAPVCTAVGGIPEVITQGESGLLVEPGQPQLLAEAVLTLLAGPYAARRMGHAARQAVTHNFGMERMARETEEVYLNVLEANRGR